MGWFDDVVDFVEDTADVVVDVVDTAVGPIADAVSEIPIVGDVVETVAPFGGLLGTMIGGPVGGMIGNTIGDQFGDGGGGFDFLDTAINVFGGGALPGGLGDIAGDLLGGGSLIDTATSVFGGDLGGVAANLLGGGGLGDVAGGLLGGGDLGDIAGGLLGGGDLGGLLGGDLGGLLGGDLGGDLGGIAQQFLGGSGGPDLGGLGNLLGAADSVFGGLGLGNLGSAASGIIGDCTGGGSDGGGWLGDILDNVPGVGAGMDLPFGLGSLPSLTDIAGPISQAGGGWLNQVAQQAGEVAQQMGGADGGGGGMFGHLFDQIEDQIGTVAYAIDPDPLGLGNTTINPNDAFEQLMQDVPDTQLDDLVFNLPGVDADRAARDALQQLADSGGLGDALATMSQNDIATLVTSLITPTQSPFDVITDPVPAAGGLDDGGLTLPGGQTEGYNDPLGVGVDDLTGDLNTMVGADAAPDANAMGGDPTGAATSGVGAADSGQVSVDDFSLDGGMDASGGAAYSPPAEPEFTAPEPEPAQSDFSESMAQADAVETQLDDDVDDFFTGLG